MDCFMQQQQYSVQWCWDEMNYQEESFFTVRSFYSIDRIIVPDQREWMYDTSKPRLPLPAKVFWRQEASGDCSHTVLRWNSHVPKFVEIVPHCSIHNIQETKTKQWLPSRQQATATSSSSDSRNALIGAHDNYCYCGYIHSLLEREVRSRARLLLSVSPMSVLGVIFSSVGDGDGWSLHKTFVYGFRGGILYGFTAQEGKGRWWGGRDLRSKGTLMVCVRNFCEPGMGWWQE